MSGKDPVAHILFIRDEYPEVYRNTVTFLEPVDYLNLKLTGRTCASFDSIAAHWVTNNRRIDAVDYDAGLLAMVGLDRAKPSRPGSPGTIIGTVTPERRRRAGHARRRAGGHRDRRRAFGGDRVGRGGRLRRAPLHRHVVVDLVPCPVQEDRCPPQRGLHSVGPGREVPGGRRARDGRCLPHLRGRVDALGLRAWLRHTSNAKWRPQRAPGAGRMLFTPWLNGERSPVDDHTIRGGFHNLSLSTTRAEMVRAVYEGVAFNRRWLLGAVERFAGRRLGSLAFIGGGANSDVWCQIHADVLERPIRQVAEPVLANVRGAGLLTLLALGRTIRLGGQPPMVATQRTYEPDPATAAVYDELYGEFVGAVQADQGHPPPPEQGLRGTREIVRPRSGDGRARGRDAALPRVPHTLHPAPGCRARPGRDLGRDPRPGRPGEEASGRTGSPRGRCTTAGPSTWTS